VLCLGAATLGSVLAPDQTGTNTFTDTVLPDWSDYEPVHADRRNLRIHLIAVPLFDIGFIAALTFLARADFISAIVSLLVAFGSMVSQAKGHAKEAIAPRPFKGLPDFLKRWFSEQYLIFPLFVLSGRWWRQYQAADFDDSP